MREDLRKSKEQDLVVCNACGSEKISEKIWVDSNSYVQIDGQSYFKYVEGVDDTQYWCDNCNTMSHPVHISEWEEIKREKKDA